MPLLMRHPSAQRHPGMSACQGFIITVSLFPYYQMDSTFPHQLFPSYFNSGPSSGEFRHTAYGWGRYDHVVGVSTRQDGPSHLADWTFTTSHRFRGETWLPTEPVPVPLLSPKAGLKYTSVSPDDMDFVHHMQNFYLENYEDAFYSISQLLGEHFFFPNNVHKWKDTKLKLRYDPTNEACMSRTRNFMKRLPYKRCEFSSLNRTLTTYGNLLYDVIPDIPVDLLAGLVEEELNQHRDKLTLNEQTTGGALAYIPFTQGSTGDSQHGCLLYPGQEAFSLLKFHKVVLEVREGKPAHLDTTSNKPQCFQLKGAVRQISSASRLNQCCVGVRSDYLCGVWRLDETMTPRLLKVVETREPASCINVSPHVLGEVLVASNSGAAHLWTVGKGMQTVREEDSNLYFNAQSPWRWCDFSGHPRVMVYADRTGAELTDIRTRPTSSHSLFRVGEGPECKIGERVINTKYLRDVHSFHHLVTTQFSAYILDERVPGVPMLKWEHMMEHPPVFGHVLPGSSSSCVLGGASSSTTKVVLGSQTSQDLALLQYSGGRAEACVRVGPPQMLLRPRDSLAHLPVQIPHRQEAAISRISQPAAGLTCIQKDGGGAGGVDCIWVLQLTEAGDIFYQILQQQQQQHDDVARMLQDEFVQPQSGVIKKSPQKQQPPAQTDTSVFHRNPTIKERLLLFQDGMPNSQEQPLVMDSDEDMFGPTQSQSFVPEMSSDEDIIGPTQSQSFVRETSSDVDIIGPTQSQSFVPETSSDEDNIGPSQSFVPETQEQERPQSAVAMAFSRQASRMRRFSGSSSEDSQVEGPRRRILASLGLEVVVNKEPDEQDCDEENLLPTSQSTDKGTDVGTQETVRSIEGENADGVSHVHVERTAPPSTSAQLSEGALAAWNRWLQKLTIKARRNRKPQTQPVNEHAHTHPQTYHTAPTKKLRISQRLHSDHSRDVESARRDMRECMAKGSVLVSDGTAELVPLPNPVDPDVWPDNLSERLTVSWTGGEEEYSKWWQEHLGLNNEAKMDSLRSKRKRQKEERRRRRVASGTSELSGSFSSSSGWSSSGVGGWYDIDLDSTIGGFMSEQDFTSQQDVMSESSMLATQLANSLPSVAGRQEGGEQGQQSHRNRSPTRERCLGRPVEQSQENSGSLAPPQEESTEPQNVTVDNVKATNINSAISERSSTPALQSSSPFDSRTKLLPQDPMVARMGASQPSVLPSMPQDPMARMSFSQPYDFPSATPDPMARMSSSQPYVFPSATQDPMTRMSSSQPSVLPSFSLQSAKGGRTSLSQLQTPKKKKSRMGF